MKYRLYAVFYQIVVGLATASCGFPFLSGDDPGEVPELNLPVLANAGADREILRGYLARLEGDGTHNPGRRLFTVRWQQIDGEPVHLSNQASLTPTFLAPLEEQNLTFRLVADDRVWTTTDEVTLRVRRQPVAVAPRIGAGPDRYVDEDDEIEPGAADIASTLSVDITSTWTRPEIGVSSNRAKETAALEVEAEIFRLSAIRGELSSAPDHLLLYSFDPERLGDKSPTAALGAPDIVAPGEVFNLDASLSTDVNGDTLRLRWEQTHGTPVLDLAPNGKTLTVTAPSQPQELVFRVFASDGALESAPAQVSVVVNSDSLAPVVAPQRDSRTHPENTFLLDADGVPTPEDDPSITFTWAQTIGEAVDLEIDTTGRFARFVAPVAPGDLAFAVVAELPPVQSTPEVARVTVVDIADNLPPEIFLCHDTATIDSNLVHVITALVADPEADEISTAVWSLATEPLVEVVLHTHTSEEIIETALCGLQRRGPYPDWAALAIIYQADFAPPDVPTTVTVSLTACDALVACDDDETAIAIQ